MRNFQDSFERSKLSFISAFSICMTVSLINITENIRKALDDGNIGGGVFVSF